MIEVWKLKSRATLEHRFLNELLIFVKFLEERVSLLLAESTCGCSTHSSNLCITSRLSSSVVKVMEEVRAATASSFSWSRI